MSPENTILKPVAHIHSDFSDKFGIPRQSNLADTDAEIIFEPEFASPEAVRGLENYSYLWIIWQFSKNIDQGWHPTVRPPRLGGNARIGVFATRSPFRPNPLGLSSVRLISVELREKIGPVLHVRGADLLDGTPVYDIKPYLPYVDSHPDAKGGFAENLSCNFLQVEIPAELLSSFPEDKLHALKQILSQDPRPHYQKDPDRIYGCEYAGFNILFRVRENILTVTGIALLKEEQP